MRNAILLLMLFCTSAVFADKVNSPDSYNVKRAVEAIQNGDSENAYKYLNQETDEHPENGYAYMWLSILRNYDGDYGLALSAANTAVKKIPAKDKTNRATAYYSRAKIWLNLEDTLQAIKDYTEAIKCTPEDLDIYKERAQVYFEQEKYDLADQDYRKMISLDEGDVVGYVGLGRNASERKNYDEAIKQYNYVEKLAPDYADVYNWRAISYSEMGKYSEALDDAITSLSKDHSNETGYRQILWLADSIYTQTVVKLKAQKIKEPKESIWMYCLGAVYEQAKNYAEAIRNYKENFALEQLPSVAGRIASCYESQGNYDKAVNYYEQAMALDSADTYYIFQSANALNQFGRADEALKMMNKYVEANPDNYAAYMGRAQMKSDAGNIDGAVEDCTICLTLEPSFAYAYLVRGKLYKQKGDTEKARKDFEQCIQLDSIPENNTNFFAYYYLGNKEKALEELNKALESAPDDTYYNAACLYSLVGDKENALKYLRLALEGGYENFNHISRDKDLDNVRSEKEFEALINEFKQKQSEQNVEEDNSDNDVYEQQTEEVPFSKDGGVCKVKCHINNLPLHFIFDTGASDVSISSVEATFMMKNDYLTAADVLGKQNYMTADGNISEGTIINLKDVQLGSLHLRNIRASVVRNQSAPLLLGQSALSKLGKIEIDNDSKVLRITYRKKVN